MSRTRWGPWLVVLATACSSGDGATTTAATAEPEAALPPSPAPSAPTPAPAPLPAPADAPPAASIEAAAPVAAAEASADCDGYHRGLSGMVGRTVRASDASKLYKRAVARLDEADADCRDGRWHVAAARLLRYEATPIAGFKNPGQALRAGLAQPPDRELLTMVAFLAGLGSGPALPGDACDRVRRAPPVPGPEYESDDRAAYVCGHAARTRGAWRTAEKEFASITMKARYPDLALRRAQVAFCARKRSRRLERAARKLKPMVSTAFGASHDEHELLREQARSSELRRLSCTRRR